MAERMQTLGKDVKGFKKIISTWAKKQGLEHSMNQIYGKSKKSPLLFPLADKLVLSQVYTISYLYLYLYLLLIYIRLKKL